MKIGICDDKLLCAILWITVNFALAFALALLLGWSIYNPFHIDINSSHSFMKIITSTYFLMSGLSLMFFLTSHKTSAVVIACTLLLFSGCVILTRLLGNQWFVGDEISKHSIYGYIASLDAAICFFLIGISLIVTILFSSRLIFSFLAVVCCLISFTIVSLLLF